LAGTGGTQSPSALRYLQRIAATTRGERIAIEDCLPGSEFLFIDAQGRISPSSFSSTVYGISVDEIDSVEEFPRAGFKSGLI
jgi:MoaA/NifB/PqqE/SkfB family radical SAM enzyme